MPQSEISAQTTELVRNATPQAFQADNFFNRNKQKLLALAGLTVSFLMSDPTLPEDLDPRVFSWTVRILAILGLWFAFLNNPPKEGG
jgi:lysozyme family protein